MRVFEEHSLMARNTGIYPALRYSRTFPLSRRYRPPQTAF